jgi:hypothetical protein
LKKYQSTYQFSDCIIVIMDSFLLKGVFSKPSGGHIVAPFFCF